MIYFNHIPRTSGTSISHAIYSAFNKELRILTKPIIEQFDPYFNKNIRESDYQSFLRDCHLNVDFFYGHHFSSPYIEPYSQKLETFSIIRNPLERSISEFYYINNYTNYQDWIDVKIHEINSYLDLFPKNEHCRYLFSNYDWAKMRSQKNRVAICWPEENQISFNEILSLIKEKNIKLSTIENRLYLLNELEICLNKINKTNIIADKQLKENQRLHRETRQEFDNIKYFLSQEEIEKFKNINNLDYQLYNYIKDHEIKTGRCLTPDDINV